MIHIKNNTALTPYLTIPSLVALFVPMHRAHGKLSRLLPGSGGRRRGEDEGGGDGEGKGEGGSGKWQ